MYCDQLLQFTTDGGLSGFVKNGSRCTCHNLNLVIKHFLDTSLEAMDLDKLYKICENLPRNAAAEKLLGKIKPTEDEINQIFKETGIKIQGSFIKYIMNSQYVLCPCRNL